MIKPDRVFKTPSQKRQAMQNKIQPERISVETLTDLIG